MALIKILIIAYQDLLDLANVHCMKVALGIVLVDGVTMIVVHPG